MDVEPLRSFALQSVCCTRGLLGQLPGRHTQEGVLPGGGGGGGGLLLT